MSGCSCRSSTRYESLSRTYSESSRPSFAMSARMAAGLRPGSRYRLSPTFFRGSRSTWTARAAPRASEQGAARVFATVPREPADKPRAQVSLSVVSTRHHRCCSAICLSFGS
eukprot:scaffold6500_cov109-Isochrysis_galbana.AAC.2